MTLVRLFAAIVSVLAKHVPAKKVKLSDSNAKLFPEFPIFTLFPLRRLMVPSSYRSFGSD